MRLESGAVLLNGLSDDPLEDTILTEQLEEQRQCRVLVVDDDDLVRAKLSSLLRGAQYDVEQASSGEEALRVLGRSDCHLVLTDWQMPDMDGLKLCREIRRAHKEAYIYVLMLTVRGTKKDMLEGLASGADDYIVKGSPITEVLARLEVGRRITHVDHSLRAANQENRRLSLIDQLTQAYNLRYFVKYMPRELHRAQRYGHALAVLSCDIDDFKQVNDRLGHAVGDDVLCGVVHRCDSSIRQGSDWIARTGGDEFLIVLPETPTHGAAYVAKKLRQSFLSEPIATRAGPVKISVSIGVTAVDAHHPAQTSMRVEDLVRTADRSMYGAKRAGLQVAKSDGAGGLEVFDSLPGCKNEIN
jgi:two-component system cell cycle response regulator